MPRHEFSNRRDLWLTDTHSKYMPPWAFGHCTGMSCNWFKEIWDCIQFSYQPDTCPEETPSQEYCWMLVEDFVHQFNQDREQYFTPSLELVGDESMSRWYGLGGYWTNCGLPMYVEMDSRARKCRRDTDLLLWKVQSNAMYETCSVCGCTTLLRKEQQKEH